MNPRPSPAVASWLAARKLGAIAYSPTLGCCVCAPCLKRHDPQAPESAELGVLVVASTDVPDYARFCSACGADLLCVIGSPDATAAPACPGCGGQYPVRNGRMVEHGDARGSCPGAGAVLSA